jgi:uncharacterized protein DUF4383
MNRNPAQSVALLGGVVLIALGVLGFVPGVTTNEGSIAFAGHGSGAKLIGDFQVSILLGLAYIVIGAAGVALARTIDGARRYLTGGGALFLVLWALGLANAGKWIPVNAADDWLHLGLGVALLGLGFASSGSLRVQTA